MHVCADNERVKHTFHGAGSIDCETLGVGKTGNKAGTLSRRFRGERSKARQGSLASIVGYLPSPLIQ